MEYKEEKLASGVVIVAFGATMSTVPHQQNQQVELSMAIAIFLLLFSKVHSVRKI